MNNNSILEILCGRHPSLTPAKKAISDAAEMIINCYSDGGKMLVCGNGGSCSDSEHLVGELMKSFELKRPIKKEIVEKLAEVSVERGNYLAQKLEYGFPAICLSSQTALTTAISNDIDANLVFAQQIIGYGCEKDVLFAISTSANSQNMVDACITAKAISMKVIGLTGMTGGKMKQYCNILVNVPEKRTVYVQELQLPVIHALCQLIEDHFFSDNILKQ